MASDTAIKALITKGFSVRKAAEFLGISPTSVMRVRKEMTAQAQPGEISGFLCPARDEKTAKLIDHFFDKGLRVKEIKGSDALGAAKMYADRRWPVQQAAPPNPRISFVQINVDVARADLHVSEPLDVTPTAGPASTPTGSGVSPPGLESGEVGEP